MYNSQNTSKRKGADDKAYAEGWDRIFKKEVCPECGMPKPEHKLDCSRNQEDK